MLRPSAGTPSGQQCECADAGRVFAPVQVACGLKVGGAPGGGSGFARGAAAENT